MSWPANSKNLTTVENLLVKIISSRNVVLYRKFWFYNRDEWNFICEAHSGEKSYLNLRWLTVWTLGGSRNKLQTQHNHLLTWLFVHPADTILNIIVHLESCFCSLDESKSNFPLSSVLLSGIWCWTGTVLWVLEAGNNNMKELRVNQNCNAEGC